MLKVFGLLVSLNCVASSALAQAIDAAPERDASTIGAVDILELTSPDFRANTVGNIFWSEEIERPGADFLRIRMSLNSRNGVEGANLTIVDASGRPVQQISLNGLVVGKAYWSDVIQGARLTAVLRGGDLPTNLSLTIDRVAYQVDGAVALSTVGKDEKQAIGAFQDDPIVWNVQKSVAQLSLIQNGLPAVCSGFLVGQNSIMTNHHCVASQQECEDARVIFGYQQIEGANFGLGMQIDCSLFDESKSDRALDYSIFQLKASPGEDWPSVSLKEGESGNDGDPVFIVQHPNGERKQISYVNCAIETMLVDGSRDFTHTCDTVGGSSGSPVFNRQGKLVGMHHFGFKDEGIWTKNRAVDIQSILDHLGDNL